MSSPDASVADEIMSGTLGRGRAGCVLRSVTSRLRSVAWRTVIPRGSAVLSGGAVGYRGLMEVPDADLRRPPPASSEGVRRRMQKQASRDTKPEMALRRALHARGMRYRVHLRPVPSLRREADVVFTRAKVCVMVDGCHWHRCPDHYRPPRSNAEWWAAKIQRNVDRDAETDVLLREAGWTVVRVWEHEDPERAAERVQGAVRRSAATRRTR